jgi:hypothetical protein
VDVYKKAQTHLIFDTPAARSLNPLAFKSVVVQLPTA